MNALKIAAVLLLTLAATAGAQEPGAPPLEAYRTNTQFGMLICQTTMMGALAKAELGEPAGETEDWRGCIKKQKAEALRYFQAATTKAKKATFREALKSYHVAWSTAMQGLEPALSERRIDYQRRQAAAGQRLTEAWARVEIEQ